MSSVDDLLFSLIMLINKVTCEVLTLSVSLFLMTGEHFRITDAFTVVILARQVGIAEDSRPPSRSVFSASQ